MNESRITTGISRYGKWSVEDSGRFVYKPEKNAGLLQDVLLFKERMFNGTIRAKVRIDAYNDNVNSCFRFVIGHSCLSGCSYTCGIGGYDSAFVLARTSEAAGALIWRAIALEGEYEALKHFEGKSVEISLRLRGSQVFLSVEGTPVWVTDLPSPIESTQLGLFAWGVSQITVEEVIYQKEPLSAFLMIPFTTEYDQFYANVLCPLASNKGIELKRCKDLTTPTVIFDDIREGIEKSDILIAEISEQNPNVFYEIGYAHALQKKVILISKKFRLKDAPFDVRSNRIVAYDAHHFGEEPFIRDFVGALEYFLSRYEE